VRPVALFGCPAARCHEARKHPPGFPPANFAAGEDACRALSPQRVRMTTCQKRAAGNHDSIQDHSITQRIRFPKWREPGSDSAQKKFDNIIISIKKMM